MIRLSMRIGRVLLITAALLIVVPYFIYLVGVNGLLASAVGRRLMNSHPDIVRISFAHAWSIWPGRFHVRLADISGQDAKVQFQLTAEEAAISFSPRGLADQVVTVKDVRGHGFTLHLRRRVSVLPPPAELEALAPIQYFPSPLTDAVPQRHVGVRLEDVDVQGMKEVWFDEYRLLADIDIKANLYIKPEQALRVYPASLVVRDGALTIASKPAADVRGSIQVTCEKLGLVGLQLADLKVITLLMNLHVGLPSISFLNHYLPASSIQLGDGGGELLLDVNVARGVLAGGSSISFTTDRFHLLLPKFWIGSSFAFHLEPDEKNQQATFAMELGSSTLFHRDTEKPYVRSKTIRIQGHTTDLDLTHPQELVLKLDVPEASVSDFTFLNHYIPAGTAAHVDHGAGKLAAHFEIDTAKESVSGHVDVEGSGLSVQNASAHLRGGARLHVAVGHFNLRTWSADLGGSHFSLDDVAIRYDGKENPHWWLRLDLPRCLVHPSGKHKLDTTAHVNFKNLQPVMGIVSANKHLPSIVQTLSNKENVEIDGHLLLGDTTLHASGLRLKAGDLSGRADLFVSDLQKKKPRVSGPVLMKLGGIAVGLQLHDSTVKPILYRPEHWFDGQQSPVASTDPVTPHHASQTSP